MKTIKLDSFGIVLIVDEEKPGGGSISSGLERETCSCCGLPDCCFNCDESKADGGFNEAAKMDESEEDVAGRLQYNGVLDGIEAMTLAHACAGIDVASPAYLEGIETAIQGAANNL